MSDTRCVHLVAREVLHAATCKFVMGRGFLPLFNSEAQIRELRRRKSDKESDEDKGTGDRGNLAEFFKCRRSVFSVTDGIQGARIKNNPLEKILYLRNCSRFFHQIYAVYRGGFRPCIQQIVFKYLV